MSYRLVNSPVLGGVHNRSSLVKRDFGTAKVVLA